MVILVRVLNAPASGYDKLALRDKAVRDLDRLIERAAGILAQVEHETRHPLPGEIAQGVPKFTVRVLAEIAHADITRGRVQHHGHRHRRHQHGIARDLQIDQLVVADAPNADIDRGAPGAAQLLHRVIRRPALRVVFLDPGDDITAAKALLVCRWSFEDLADRQIAVDRADLDTEAEVTSLLALAHLPVIVGAHEAGVRVQRLEHAADGAVHQAIRLRLADIVVLNCLQSVGEDAVLLIQLILGECPAAGEAAGERTKDHHEDGCGERPVMAHIP